MAVPAEEAKQNWPLPTGMNEGMASTSCSLSQGPKLETTCAKIQVQLRAHGVMGGLAGSACKQGLPCGQDQVVQHQISSGKHV